MFTNETNEALYLSDLAVEKIQVFTTFSPSVKRLQPREILLFAQNKDFLVFTFVMSADLWQSDGGGRSAFPDRSDRSRRLPAQVHRTDHDGCGHHARRPLRLQSRCQVLRDLLGSGHLVSKQVVVCHSDIKNITREQIPWLMRAIRFMSVIKDHIT